MVNVYMWKCIHFPRLIYSSFGWCGQRVMFELRSARVLHHRSATVIRPAPHQNNISHPFSSILYVTGKACLVGPNYLGRYRMNWHEMWRLKPSLELISIRLKARRVNPPATVSSHSLSSLLAVRSHLWRTADARVLQTSWTWVGGVDIMAQR